MKKTARTNSQSIRTTTDPSRSLDHTDHERRTKSSCLPYPDRCSSWSFPIRRSYDNRRSVVDGVPERDKTPFVRWLLSASLLNMEIKVSGLPIKKQSIWRSSNSLANGPRNKKDRVRLRQKCVWACWWCAKTSQILNPLSQTAAVCCCAIALKHPQWRALTPQDHPRESLVGVDATYIDSVVVKTNVVLLQLLFQYSYLLESAIQLSSCAPANTGAHPTRIVGSFQRDDGTPIQSASHVVVHPPLDMGRVPLEFWILLKML